MTTFWAPAKLILRWHVNFFTLNCRVNVRVKKCSEWVKKALYHAFDSWPIASFYPLGQLTDALDWLGLEKINCWRLLNILHVGI